MHRTVPLCLGWRPAWAKHGQLCGVLEAVRGASLLASLPAAVSVYRLSRRTAATAANDASTCRDSLAGRTSSRFVKVMRFSWPRLRVLLLSHCTQSASPSGIVGCLPRPLDTSELGSPCFTTASPYRRRSRRRPSTSDSGAPSLPSLAAVMMNGTSNVCSASKCAGTRKQSSRVWSSGSRRSCASSRRAADVSAKAAAWSTLRSCSCAAASSGSVATVCSSSARASSSRPAASCCCTMSQRSAGSRMTEPLFCGGCGCGCGRGSLLSSPSPAAMATIRTARPSAGTEPPFLAVA